MKTVLTVVLTLAAATLLFIAYLWAGWYNVAATDHHNGLTLWLMDFTLEHSVEHHAASQHAPTALQDSATIRLGAYHYQHMCTGCHGAPGLKLEGEDRVAMYPEPPDFTKDIGGWTPSQFFWIVKSGIKMSGMPAFGGTDSDDELWAIAVFAPSLPKLSAEQYRALYAAMDSTADHDDHESTEEQHHH
jgi:mono/diheme cytochrome c family protein